MLLLLSVHWCEAQTISYGYDDAGHRISRKIITLKSAKVSEVTSTAKNNEVYEENLGEQKIFIFPNPTRGELKVEISGYEKSTQTALYLYSLSGTLLLNKTSTNSFMTLDLSTYPIGTYILKIILDNNLKEWKIVKE